MLYKWSLVEQTWNKHLCFLRRVWPLEDEAAPNPRNTGLA